MSKAAVRAAISEVVTEVAAPGVGAAEGRWWSWRSHRVRYVTAGQGPAVVLIHGFGASADYFRRTLPTLVGADYTFYALDLLGKGLSEKPPEYDYSIDLWAEQVQDFCVWASPGEPVVLLGNSIGSLIAITAAASAWGRDGGVRGLLLLNVAGGMNVGHMVTDDLTPPGLKVAASLIFGALKALLSLGGFASWFFERLKTPGNVSQVMKSIYVNKDAVDDELVEGILAPAEDPNALAVFVKILTGDPGTSPDKLMPLIKIPVLLIWGDDDTFTPLNGAYGSYMQGLAQTVANVSFKTVRAGHIPHDDNPAEVHALALPWLADLHGHN